VIPRGFGGSYMHDALHYLDRVALAYKPRAILKPDGHVMTDIFVADNLHLNDLGNAIWGATIKAALMPMEARYEAAFQP
jgi:hypothetical protein